MAKTEEIRARIKELERLLQKRRNKPGFSANVADIEDHLAAARAELSE